jgi:hypothetical protein
MTIFASLQEQLDRIRYHVDNQFELPDRSDELATVEAVRAKLLIDGFFLGITSLVCLGFFFTAHG